MQFIEKLITSCSEVTIKYVSSDLGVVQTFELGLEQMEIILFTLLTNAGIKFPSRVSLVFVASVATIVVIQYQSYCPNRHKNPDDCIF